MPGDPVPFATLLRVRQRQEDLKARALAVELRAAARLSAERAALVEEQRRTLARARVEAGALFDASEVRRYYQYERYLARCADEKDAQIRKQEAVVAGRREELTDALKQKKKIEKLRERKRRAILGTLRKTEMMLLDEVAVNRAARRKDEETQP